MARTGRLADYLAFLCGVQGQTLKSSQFEPEPACRACPSSLVSILNYARDAAVRATSVSLLGDDQAQEEARAGQQP